MVVIWERPSWSEKRRVLVMGRSSTACGKASSSCCLMSRAGLAFNAGVSKHETPGITSLQCCHLLFLPRPECKFQEQMLRCSDDSFANVSGRHDLQHHCPPNVILLTSKRHGNTHNKVIHTSLSVSSN